MNTETAKIECQNCVYWIRNNTNHHSLSKYNGNCKINSPKVFKCPKGLYTPNGTITVWPETNEHDFCGKFKIKINT